MTFRILPFISITLIGAILMLLQESCTTAGHRVEHNQPQPDKQVFRPSPAMHGSQYESSAVMNTMSVSEHFALYKNFFFGKEQTNPPGDLPQKLVDVDRLASGDRGQLMVSWLGHSSLLITVDGYTILTDPLFERRVSPVGPTRFHKTLPLRTEDVPHIDIVIVSHNHYDHLNKYSIRQLIHKTAMFIVPLKVGELLESWGVPHEKIVELAWWQECDFGRDLMVAATPAQHFSGRGLFDRNRTLWASWVIKAPNHKLFFSGDSGYFEGFKTIGETYGPFGATFIECGAYNERWSSIHMFPEQTVQAHLDLRGTVLHPIHNATFNLALHPWYEPMERVVRAASRSGVELSMPVIGSIVEYEHRSAEQPWWRSSMDRPEIGSAADKQDTGIAGVHYRATHIDARIE